jgi:hypothetical protein
MQILKSLGDGIGTAAGVAWPTFGIIFGTLGLSTGAATAIALSSISIGLFLLVFLPITYWSYKSYLKENKKLRHVLQEQRDQAHEHMLHYLISILRKCLLKNKIKHVSDLDQSTLIQHLQDEINADIGTNNYMPQIKECLNHLLNDTQNTVLSTLIEALTHSKNNDIDNMPVIIPEHKKKIMGKIKDIFMKCNQFTPKITDFSEQIKMGIIGFSAAFGSIAGCAAGTIGLLTAIGVFAGLATVPVLGWSILGVATIFGLAVAAICVQSAHKKSKKIQLFNYYEQINTELNLSAIQNNNRTDATIEAKKELSKDLRNYLGAAVQDVAHEKKFISNPNRQSNQYQPLWNNLNPSNATPIIPLAKVHKRHNSAM